MRLAKPYGSGGRQELIARPDLYPSDYNLKNPIDRCEGGANPARCDAQYSKNGPRNDDPPSPVAALPTEDEEEPKDCAYYGKEDPRWPNGEGPFHFPMHVPPKVEGAGNGCDG